MRIWKRLLGTALCLCAAVCVMSVSASAAEHSHPICGDITKCTNPDHSGGNHGDAVEWIEVTQANVTDSNGLTLEAGKSYYLGEDIKVKWDITINGTVNLCLNGHSITKTSESDTFAGVIKVESGSSFTLCDCNGSGAGNGKITHADGETGRGVLVGSPNSRPSTTSFIMYGGTISGNRIDGQDGAGVRVHNASFKMYGGTISDNCVEGNPNYGGGGVNAHDSGEFIMHGGEISRNKSDVDGGGVAVVASSFQMYGGTISGNTAKDNGGGVGLWNDSFRLSGGTISGNTATSNGGGVYFSGNDSNTLTIYDTVEISGNSAANGGGVYINSVNLTVTGGSIINNNATDSGGGVYFNGSTFNVFGNVNITGNKVNSSPNNVYLPTGKTITVAGKLTGSNQIGVTTEKLPDDSKYVQIASGNASNTDPDKFLYENNTIAVSAVVSGSTATLIACRHNWSGEWKTDIYQHWKECSICKGKNDVSAHTYDQNVAEGSYKVSDATCVSPALYHWSCVCGAKGTGTFESGVKNPDNHRDKLGGWQSNEDKHWKEYPCCNVRADEGNHQWNDGEMTTAATCTTAGEKTYTCSVCSATRTETVSATGHSWADAWMHDDTHHWHNCENANCPVTENSGKSGYAEHSGGTATCQAKAVCETCGTAYGALDAANHSGALGGWQWNEDKHWKEYSCCNVHADVGSHHWDEGRETKSPTCTTAGEKTYICTDCGRTKTEQIDALGHDWGEWVVTKPATTSAAGEETRTCKRDKSHTEKRDIPKLTPAPSGGGSSGGSSSAPAITVPVSGSGNTVHVSASVSGSTAEVKEIKSAELDKIGTDSAVVIDLSGLNKGVTGVTLSTDTIDSICKTEADGVTIKLPSAELRVDRQTLAAVTEQAAGSKIRLVVEPDGTARGTMTAAQRSTLAGMKNAAALEAYFVSDGTRIHDFKGGSVELSIPYRADGAIRAWFLKEDGTREPVSARYDKENALLILHHFSHYVIEELDSSAAYTVCAKDDSCPLGAFGDLTAAAWYHDGVHYCLENGLMRGVSGGKFLPDGSTTRAQLVTVLWRLEGSPETTGAVRFGDTAGGAWYTEAVRWAAGCGVVKGYDNGCFGPNDAVTREQMAAILYRYAQHKGYDVSAGEDTNILSFNDAFAVSEYAIPAMQWACGSGMVRGIAQKGGMALAPRDTTTRAQTATLLMRFQSAFAKEP